MKQNTFILGLVLASVLVTLSGISSDGRIRDGGKSNQNDAQKTEPAERVYDIDGNRIRADEKYVAKRSLKNGRSLGYRQNRREIAALVKALKEDGVTDEQVLSPKFWMTLKCLKYNSGCLTGAGCGSICKEVNKPMERQKNVTLLYCYCP